MPRFVLLEHDHPRLHWDLMFEVDMVLWTWRLDAVPSGGDMRTERTPDHRLLYLDYEGSVSGNRGSVKRSDHGEFTWLVREDGLLSMRLAGERLHGTMQLRRLRGDEWEVNYSPSPGV